MSSQVVLEGRRSWQEVLTSPLLMLIFLPLVLSLIHVSTPWGFRIHFFQIAILLGAYVFGPLGGAIAGAAGSFTGSLIMDNPYIIIGNVILGVATGFFARQGFRPLFAIWFAFLLQLPWLILSDYFLLSLSVKFIQNLVLSLFLSNTLWALAATFALGLIHHHDD
jgi:hypothetical protein